MPSFSLRDLMRDGLDALRFLSRLPVPGSDAPPAPLARTLRMAPLAGVPIAAGPAFAMWLAFLVGLPSLAAAGIGVGLLVLGTGALHEDGWADVADGFGGGHTVERKLAIMRDSRIGTFGGLALGLGLLLRVAGLQGLIEHRGAAAAALGLVAAAVLSRALMLLPLRLLAPARPDGLAQAGLGAGVPGLALPLGVALPVAAALGAAAHPGLAVAAALALSAAAAGAMTHLARRQIGGVTGDVVGATQQAAEIAFLLTLCIHA